MKGNTAFITLLASIACLTGTSSCHKLPKQPEHAAKVDYSGIDVSRYQRDIDWDKVGCDSLVTFVYIKATEGATLTDPYYATNIEGARKQNIKVGSYHYFSTKSTVDAQYANFSKRLKEHKQDLIPMIDVEDRGTWGRSQLIDSVTKMAQLIEQHYGRKPMIYTMADFYNTNLAPQFNAYPLYIGRYSTSKPQLKWGGKCTIWQHTEHGIITGINRHVDLCTFNDNKSIIDIKL